MLVAGDERSVSSYILMRLEELFRVEIGVDVMHQHRRTVDVHGHGHHEPADGGINKGMNVSLSLRMKPLARPQPAESALPTQLEPLQFSRKASLSRRIRNRMAGRYLAQRRRAALGRAGCTGVGHGFQTN